ncbi:hypothetical protein BC939DRAFT_504633 [Gamsiella multidivaricata]|uniref:uncharacterized protein n=1 Tax=Gamsiella multidivaricata TaxID=101098 RepID=UPI00221EF956|nr:uncharacterized protein BC939DRAFT_504633 [Gamsiella multidivaricata]KAG0370099.1 hypothetical protein BGZ54_007727 [Gamsiella multidivaricata]KAI7821092.1 hypothetical protein BC939DRAFT_504633 [Gamsiella multidivaricata]
MAHSIERQQFLSGADLFEAPVVPGNVLTQGRAYVLLDDIKNKAPSATSFRRGKRIVNYMTDSAGKSILPLRIEHRAGSTIEILKARSPCEIPPTYFSKEIAPQRRSTEEEVVKRKLVILEPRVSGDVNSQIRSSVHIYESFMQCIQGGETAQANALRNDFQDHFLMLLEMMSKDHKLKKKMFRMQQTMLDMQQILLDTQQAMKDMQQQTLERLAIIQSRAQDILNQSYDLYECPVPRLFIILPKDDDGSHGDPTNLVHNQFRLYFLCECGEHTKPTQSKNSSTTNIPHHIHMAKHAGYDIDKPAEFFREYGSYVLSLLHMLKYGISAAGFTVPALAPRWDNNDDHSSGARITQAIEHLEHLSSRGEFSDSSTRSEPHRQYSVEDLPSAESVDLGRLRQYLKSDGTGEALGNLHRMVTGERRVQWVCVDHFREAHNAMAIRDLSELVQVNCGTFEERLGRVKISLSSSVIACQFYKVMERAKIVLEFAVVLKWEVSVNDLKALQQAVYNSNIASLNLTCVAPNAASDFLSRKKRSDPLWEIMMGSKLHSFILNDYRGFFSSVGIPARTNNLRTLKIFEHVDWKKEGARVIGLLRQCPRLTDLHLGCTNAEDAYTSIMKTTTGFCPLEQLALDGGVNNGLLVRFRRRNPVWMDLLLTNPSSQLLVAAQGLRNLHLRLLSQAEINAKLLEDIISKNPTLHRLTIQCAVSDFQRILMVVKETVSMSSSSALTILSLYSNRNQLFAKNLQDEASATLELMSTSVSAETLSLLLKVHGPRLTRLRINEESIKCLSTLGKALQNSGSILNRLEIASTYISASALNDLRLILRCSRSTLSVLTITVYSPWDGSRGTSDLSDFIVEFDSLWTEIIVGIAEVGGWKTNLKLRGFKGPDKLFTLVPSFVQRINRLESHLGILSMEHISKLHTFPKGLAA